MSNSLPDNVLSHDMFLLQLNIEASVRCGKERTPALTAFYANTCAATWTAHRLLAELALIAPERAAALVADLEAELEDGGYLEVADERADAAGIDVAEFADGVRASIAKATETVEAGR